MVFPSLPVYLDPPNNWSQQQTNQQAGVGIQNPAPSPPQPLPPSTAGVRGGGHQQQGCSIRAGSMADRARLAKVPQPEAAQKCPRCESTNTKFCYYNNYSLSQPRHFCKTCRRYWTRGGALRNVPVGGGCRRNKRSKGGSSRSKSDSPMMKAARSSSATANSSSTASDVIIGRHLPTQLPLLGNNVHHCNNYVSGGIGLHFSAAGTSSDAEFQIGNNGSSMLSNGLNEQWRLPNLQQVHHHQQQQQHQQFPLFTNLEQPPFGLFQFDHGENNNGEQPQSYMGGYGSRLRSNKTLDAGVSGIMPQLTTVKMEENQGLSLSNSILGSSANHQFWGAANGNNNAWNDIPGFSSSTSSHLL